MTDTSERRKQLSAEVVLDIQGNKEWGRYITLRTWEGRLEEIVMGFETKSRLPLLIAVQTNVNNFGLYLERKEMSIHLKGKSISVFPKSQRHRYLDEVISNDCIIEKEHEDGSTMTLRYTRAFGNVQAHISKRAPVVFDLPQGYRLTDTRGRGRGRGRGGVARGRGSFQSHGGSERSERLEQGSPSHPSSSKPTEEPNRPTSKTVRNKKKNANSSKPNASRKINDETSSDTSGQELPVIQPLSSSGKRQAMSRQRK